MSTETSVRPPVRLLVIGAGPAPDALHLPVLATLRDRGEVVLALVCDIQYERAAAARHKFGFLEAGGDGSAALERADIDAVYIFGSAQLHYEYGMLALRRGKHLFVEKPVASTYAQARELAEIARARGLIAAGGLNRRFAKSLAAVRARAGKTGWRLAEVVFHKPEFGNPPSFGAHTWLSANGIHALDTLLFMMGGLPEQLTAHAGESGAAQPGAFSALMRWRDGAHGVFLCNNNAGSRREEYVFHAPDETCSVTASGLTVEAKGHPVTSLALPMQGDGYAAEHDAFLRAIRSGTEPLHSLAAIAPSMFLAELIENGFSGRVKMPLTELRADPRRLSPEEKSILVVPSVELQAPLASILAQYRLVTLEDVRQSTAARSDIVAALLGRGSSALPADVLAKLPCLGVVGIVALSLARHEPEALLARGIRLVNGSSAYAESVAEFAFGLAILGRRRAFLSHDVMRAGGWGVASRTPGFKGMMVRVARGLRPGLRAVGLEPFFLRLWRVASPWVGISGQNSAQPRDLQGATVGLVGWGENARAFAERLGRVQAHVLVYSEHASEDDIRSSGAIPASLSEVLASDIVSLHRGLTERTRHCLGAAELARLRPGAVLINIARGALIEPNALLARLKRGDIFACLDTFEEEPLIGPHPLRRLRNVFLTSHIAGGSPDNYSAAAVEVVSKVAAHLADDRTPSISAERLQTMS
ncbi:MAG TPA: NAD(P)-dependent oxidoreductase [Steroidobacteraceae bacterium]|jgi:phosphoglycerate dehydrogenase-like enzyme/predicted dehydrogenase